MKKKSYEKNAFLKRCFKILTNFTDSLLLCYNIFPFVVSCLLLYYMKKVKDMLNVIGLHELVVVGYYRSFGKDRVGEKITWSLLTNFHMILQKYHIGKSGGFL